MKLDDIKKRVDKLIFSAEGMLQEHTEKKKQNTGIFYSINDADFFRLRATCLSLIEKLYDSSHSYYKEFNSDAINKLMQHRIQRVEAWVGILKAIKEEIEGGWLVNLKGLVSAEIFADFLEMAEYLLGDGYKDAAAVMIGSTLEEHLRQLCIRNSIEIETNPNTEKAKPKKADGMNNDLGSAGVYEKLDQKSITAWLDLRNKAAHGLYGEYSKEQVALMCAGGEGFYFQNKVA